MGSMSDIVKRGAYLLDSHSTGILTGVGITGVITTAYLSAKAAFRASEVIDLEKKSRFIKQAMEDVNAPIDELTLEEKVRLTGHLYVPAIATGVSTILAIIMSNRLASKEAAALTAAYTLSEKAFSEYKDKVVEKIGDNQEMTIRDELAQERVSKYPINSKEIILAGTGEVLCFDLLTGRYFQSTMEKIRQAENKINFEIVNVSYASLSTFYDEIGLPAVTMSDILGWNLDNRLEIRFSTVISADQRPCLAIDFVFPPVPDYGKHVY